MQKKRIALAIAALIATPVCAQSSVTLYGIVDYGLVSRSGSSGDALPDFNGKTEFVSGVQAGSRLGFKGSEDLGNGLKAIFEIEFGLSMDSGTTSSTTWGNRHSWVGMTGGFGTVIGGRLDAIRYNIINKYDPFVAGTLGNAAQMMPVADREDNAVTYISPSWNGLNLVLSYSNQVAGQENSGNRGDNRLMAANVNYDNGPLSLSADYEQMLSHGNSDNRLWTATFGGSYDFKVVKLMAAYDIIKSDPGVTWSVINTTGLNGVHDQKTWLVGITAPIGNRILARALYLDTSYDDAYGVEDVEDFDASKWAVGMDYNLSKRTNLYLDYGQISNDDNGLSKIAYSGPINAVTSSAAYGTRGFDIGIRHKF